MHLLQLPIVLDAPHLPLHACRQVVRQRDQAAAAARCGGVARRRRAAQHRCDGAAARALALRPTAATAARPPGDGGLMLVLMLAINADGAWHERHDGRAAGGAGLSGRCACCSCGCGGVAYGCPVPARLRFLLLLLLAILPPQDAADL